MHPSTFDLDYERMLSRRKARAHMPFPITRDATFLPVRDAREPAGSQTPPALPAGNNSEEIA